MGIPRFIAALKQKYPSAFAGGDIRSFGISSLSIDFNSLIHEAAMEVYAYGKFRDEKRQELLAQATKEYLEATLHQAIGKKISDLINAIQPRDLLVLAIDGVATLAKIQQQRQRRYKSALKPASPIFDNSCITPGTEFMMNLDRFIESWIYQNRPILPNKIIYSSHLTPGEGEHKIFDLFRKGEYDIQKKHVVYGLDADLVVLSLLSSYDIYLVRQDVTDIVLISELARSLVGDMRTTTAVEDFGFLVTLLGNDFLPRHPMVEDLSISVLDLINLYTRLNLSLTSVTGIYYPNFIQFMKILASEEPKLLEDASRYDHRFPSRMFKAATAIIPSSEGTKRLFDYTTFRKAWYSNMFRPKGSEETLRTLANRLNVMYESLFDLPLSSIERVCYAYLEGLEWVYTYYTKGMGTVNDKWFYPFFHAPLFSDVSAIFDDTAISIIVGAVQPIESPEINCLHQLLMVISPYSVAVLPPEIREIYREAGPMCDDLPFGFPMEQDNTDKEEDFRPMVPAPRWKNVMACLYEHLKIRNFPKTKLVRFATKDNVILDNKEFKEVHQRQAQMRHRVESYNRPRGPPPVRRGPPMQQVPMVTPAPQPYRASPQPYRSAPQPYRVPPHQYRGPAPSRGPPSPRRGAPNPYRQAGASQRYDPTITLL